MAWVLLVRVDMALASGLAAGMRAQENPANEARRVQQRPPTAGLLFKKNQAGLRACEGHEGLHLPMPWHSGVSKASLAYRCGGSAGLVTPCDAPASRFTLRTAAQDT